VGPLWLDKPVYLYGPVYFLLLGSLFELFGIGIAQARLLGLLSGFGIVAVGFLILRKVRVQTPLALGTCALMALDPTFHQNIHAGRMDSMALFFILTSFYLLLAAGEREGRAAAGWCVASATFAALGVLTTPRPGYLLVPLGVLLLVRWYRRPDRQRALQVVLWGGTCLLLVAAWIAYAFGSLPAMLAYYATFSDAYASGGFGIRAIHAPLLVPLGLLLVAALVLRPRILAHEVVFFTLTGIVGFYLFVKDKGAFAGLYSFFMTPLVYLALGYLLSRLAELPSRSRATQRLQYATIGVLVLFNGSVFAARTTLEMLQRGSRSPTEAEAVIRKLIPPGSRVVGDDKFYFAVRKAGSDFQYLQRGGSLQERVSYQRDVYDFQYLITNESDGSDLFRAYAGANPMVHLATIDTPADGRLARLLTAVARKAGLGTSLMSSYEGRVFARATERAATP
jgi:4-amino-4-deoxy-L-arabinose transferase-like glycosyltransferase